MKYFIKVINNTIEETRIGVFDERAEKEFIKEGFSEIDEEEGKKLKWNIPQQFINGQVVDNKTEINKRQDTERLYNELADYKSKLTNTDYVVIKISEGVASAEEYKTVLKNRAEWRAHINEIEEALENGQKE